MTRTERFRIVAHLFDPLSLLSRRGDKWFLGNGNGLIYAPSFPDHMDILGFYDYADLYDIKVEPIFTVDILNEELRRIRLRLDPSSRYWTPSHLKQSYRSDDGIEVVEWKTVSPNNTLTSTIELGLNPMTSNSGRVLHFVPWVTCPAVSVIDAKPVGNRAVIIQRKSPSVFQAMGSRADFSSFTINLSQGSENKPVWELTPFCDKISGGSFKGEIKRQVGTDPYGLLYIGLDYQVKMKPDNKTGFSFSSSFAFTMADALDKLQTEGTVRQPETSDQSWRSFFSLVPEFHCSDPYIERYYWYRWYGLNLMTVDARQGNHPYPCVYEGLRIFRKHISYSAQCHVLETRWMRDPRLSQGSMLGLFHHQRPNGYIPGIVGLYDIREGSFYHANWGRVTTDLYKVHPDLGFLSKIYDPLSRYLTYFDSERDCDHDFLYDLVDHYESGQEYNPRYLFADPKADTDKPLQEPLEGIDATVYIYELQKSLAYLARKLGRTAEGSKFDARATQCKTAIRNTMWDAADRMFYDVRPSDHEKSKVKAATCFYPFMCDIASREHFPSIKEHLLNQKEFWTPFPVPTLSMDDEHFSADAEWKGKRMNCPWNGRVWPMTNSHIAEALVYTAESLGDESLRSIAADFISRYIRMMFFNGDVNRPNCFEHYNPITGAPSEYRGVDDYQHSWVVDLMIKYVCGIRPMSPDEKLLVIDPLPFQLDSFSIDNLSYQGHNIAVTWSKKKTDKLEEGLNIYVENKRAASSSKLERLEVRLQELR